MTKQKDAKVLWIDLEMTGLDPQVDEILEVAAIATDWDFNEIGTYESAVAVDGSLVERRMIGSFWDENDDSRQALIKQNASCKKTARNVESELIDFIKENFKPTLDKNEMILLGGNSIHQDRRFIRSEWPNLEKMLHYRMLDVSAWKVVMGGKYKRVFAKPEDHRALDDIRGSIAELQFYLKKVKK